MRETTVLRPSPTAVSEPPGAKEEAVPSWREDEDDEPTTPPAAEPFPSSTTVVDADAISAAALASSVSGTGAQVSRLAFLIV